MKTYRLIVAVEAATVIPDSNPSETCLASETVELLRELHVHEGKGDIARLKTNGRGNRLIEAA